LAGFVDSTVKEIDDRLRELKEEVAGVDLAVHVPRVPQQRRRPQRRGAAAAAVLVARVGAAVAVLVPTRRWSSCAPPLA
jgi:hypothetical protein